MNKVKNIDKASVIYTILDYLRLFVIIILVMLIVKTFVFRNKTVQGDSMYPTLEDGERAAINVAASYLTEIKRFDIVVVHSPDNDSEWVKRVIGLPNETIAYRDDILYVNDREVEETFLDSDYVKTYLENHKLSYFTENYKITLGDNEYLLVGDNRRDSLDSRNRAVGPFTRDKIISKGLFIYSPWEKARYISNGN